MRSTALRVWYHISRFYEAQGERVQIVDGIIQVQIPLPFPLRIVNCYLLRDGAGWTVIDAGINYPSARAAWQEAFDALGIQPQAIKRIILTHAHPDHYGAAGWLAAASGAPVWLAPAEQAFARAVWQSGAASEQAVSAFFEAHGMPAAQSALISQSMHETRAMTQPPPAALTLLEPGTQLQIGARHFEAIATPGHSDQHLVFYCAEERLLLCGDAVLIKITPNISLWPYGRPNPLEDFFGSLDRLGALQVELALPGHGPLIRAFGERVNELRAHHYQRLRVIEAAAGAGNTAFDVCQTVFRVDSLSPHQLRFAMAETLAHLEYLVGIGRLQRVGAGYQPHT